MKLLPLLFILSSCAFYRGPDGTTFAMVGTNAQSVGAGGLTMTGVNQTDAINTIGRTVLTNSIIQNGADVLKTGIDEGADLINSAIE
jgi:hypothetical protein